MKNLFKVILGVVSIGVLWAYLLPQCFPFETLIKFYYTIN